MNTATTIDSALTGTGLSRRAVIRAGAHAAWAAPVVTMASATPVFAASTGIKPTLLVKDYDIARISGVTYYDCRLRVLSKDNSVVGGPVTVVVRMPRGTESLSTAPSLPQASITPGWAGTGPDGPAEGPWTYTFVYPGDLTAPLSLTWRLNRTTGGRASAVVETTATASAPHAISGSDMDRNV